MLEHADCVKYVYHHDEVEGCCCADVQRSVVMWQDTCSCNAILAQTRQDLEPLKITRGYQDEAGQEQGKSSTQWWARFKRSSQLLDKVSRNKHEGQQVAEHMSRHQCFASFWISPPENVEERRCKTDVQCSGDAQPVGKKKWTYAKENGK